MHRLVFGYGHIPGGMKGQPDSTINKNRIQGGLRHFVITFLSLLTTSKYYIAVGYEPEGRGRCNRPSCVLR